MRINLGVQIQDYKHAMHTPSWQQSFTLGMTLILILTNGHTGEMINNEYRDYWVGTGQQADGSSWPIVINFGKPGGISIGYPSLKCGGSLKLLKQTGHDSIQFRETLKYGLENCSNGGTVTLKPMGPNRLRYEWRDKPGTTTGWGELQKHQTKSQPPRLYAT